MVSTAFCQLCGYAVPRSRAVDDSFEKENGNDCANELNVFECARRFSGESSAPRKYGGGNTAVGLLSSRLTF
jgi:hypothetical protein